MLLRKKKNQKKKISLVPVEVEHGRKVVHMLTAHQPTVLRSGLKEGITLKSLLQDDL